MEDFKRLFIESLGEEIAAKAFPALFGEENGITAVRFNSASRRQYCLRLCILRPLPGREGALDQRNILSCRAS